MALVEHGFQPTRWSVVVAAGAGDSATSRAALSWLCERYWEPLRQQALRRGWRPQSADDLVQQLFCQLLERRGFARADQARGRFRTWLLACLDHCAANEHERRVAAKRGGNTIRADIGDAEAATAPDVIEFDRDWARMVVDRALDRLVAAYADDGRGDVARALRPYVAQAADGDAVAAVGARLGMAAGTVRVALHRLRARFADAVRAELRETIADATEQSVEDELAVLLRALRL